MNATTLHNAAQRSRTVDLLGLILALAVTFGVAAFGAQFEPGPWYQQIAKPSWTPPGWIFPPVWSYLYLTMAVAAWLVWRSGTWAETKTPLLLYGGQLLLNGLWSWLFFGSRMIGAALIDILALLILIILTALFFWRRRKLAGAFFAPYILWVAFASGLNLVIWQMN